MGLARQAALRFPPCFRSSMHSCFKLQRAVHAGNANARCDLRVAGGPLSWPASSELPAGVGRLWPPPRPCEPCAVRGGRPGRGSGRPPSHQLPPLQPAVCGGAVVGCAICGGEGQNMAGWEHETANVPAAQAALVDSSSGSRRRSASRARVAGQEAAHTRAAGRRAAPHRCRGCCARCAAPRRRPPRTTAVAAAAAATAAPARGQTGPARRRRWAGGGAQCR